MSQINVNVIKDSNEGAPDFPSGVNVSGVTSTVTLGVTNLNTTNVNVSGVVTATTLDGNLLATGTPTLGLGVTINTSGVNISGVATAGIVSATTLYGDGSNMTGIALSIAPLNYNPAYLGADVSITPGIGLTFNQGVKAGSGEVTLRIAGAAGTVVQTWGVGSSITYAGDEISMSLVSDLSNSQVYHLSYPSGAFTNLGGDVSYVGTAYTFSAKPIINQFWVSGENTYGNLGINNNVDYSSPVQLPGNSWKHVEWGNDSPQVLATRTDGTLWVWGKTSEGQLGLNQSPTAYISSPTQVPGTTWSYAFAGDLGAIATKTDGTLWAWGRNEYGIVGQNNTTHYSSPVQIPGTTWAQGRRKTSIGRRMCGAIKTDGTLWTWGDNGPGSLGQGNNTQYSSPKQVPGTTWSEISMRNNACGGLKTDGTLWAWGSNFFGGLGQNESGPGTNENSPVQIPGTTWSAIFVPTAINDGLAALRTDGTLWTWGNNEGGALGLSQSYSTIKGTSSPTQIPGTTWTSNIGFHNRGMSAVKSDGTWWSWGLNSSGALGLNDNVYRSSPTQIGGETTWTTPMNARDLVVSALNDVQS